MSDPTAGDRPHAAYPTFAEAVRVWARVAALSFGGPAGQIAVMHRILVEEKRWIGERRFLHALNYCMLLPGPEAQQLAVYVGWLLNGTRGGLVAGALFVLPGVIALLVLSWIYVAFGTTTAVLAVFAGLAAGFPEGVAVVLALKGVGRFPDLRGDGASGGATTERFIIGTFTSVLWAAACAGLVALVHR